jgi:hypothetical protein
MSTEETPERQTQEAPGLIPPRRRPPTSLGAGTSEAPKAGRPRHRNPDHAPHRASWVELILRGVSHLIRQA